LLYEILDPPPLALLQGVSQLVHQSLLGPPVTSVVGNSTPKKYRFWFVSLSTLKSIVQSLAEPDTAYVTDGGMGLASAMETAISPTARNDNKRLVKLGVIPHLPLSLGF